MITRLLAWLFPSVPPKDQAIVLAAVEGRELQTPGSARLGEVRALPGQPEGGDGQLLPSICPSPLNGHTGQETHA